MFPLGSGSDCASEVDSCSLCEDPCLWGLNTTTYMSMLVITQSRYQDSRTFDLLCMGLASAIEGAIFRLSFNENKCISWSNISNVVVVKQVVKQ